MAWGGGGGMGWGWGWGWGWWHGVGVVAWGGGGGGAPFGTLRSSKRVAATVCIQCVYWQQQKPVVTRGSLVPLPFHLVPLPPSTQCVFVGALLQ